MHGDEQEEEERRALLVDISVAGQRLRQLVDNLLVLAQRGELESGFEPVPLAHTLRSVCSRYRLAKPERDLRLHIDDPGAIVIGSQLYLEQIVLNLLSNADKYSAAAKPIDLRLGDRDGYAVISVEDRGIGFSETDLRHLFEAHYRGEEARSRASGFGLGLAVCKRLVDAMEGQISCRNRQDGGSIFEVLLRREFVEEV